MKDELILYERELADGRVVSVNTMLFSYRICVSSFPLTYDDGWCYPHDLGREFVIAAACGWNGQGDPADGWIKHLGSGRYRAGGDPRRETRQR